MRANHAISADSISWSATSLRCNGHVEKRVQEPGVNQELGYRKPKYDDEHQLYNYLIGLNVTSIYNLYHYGWHFMIVYSSSLHSA